VGKRISTEEKSRVGVAPPPSLKPNPLEMIGLVGWASIPPSQEFG